MKKRINLSEDWHDVESIKITNNVYAIGTGRKCIR